MNLTLSLLIAAAMAAAYFGFRGTSKGELRAAMESNQSVEAVTAIFNQPPH